MNEKDQREARVSDAIEVKIPDIGDFKGVPIVEIVVKPGDVVAKDDPLLTLESDKAAMEVPSPAAGVVREIVAKVGDKVSVGTLVLKLEPAGDAASEAMPADGKSAENEAAMAAVAKGIADAAKAPTAAAPAPAAAPAGKPVDFDGVHASPAVRRLARELDLDLRPLTGTGEKGRITKDDLKRALGGGAGAAAGAGIPEIPAVDFAKFGPVETKPMSRIRKLSGPHLHRAWLNVPHVTHSDEADVTELEAFRKRLDDEAKADKKAPYRVSMLPFLMKASVAALKKFPDFNSSLAPGKDALIRKGYWNVGVAVDTPDGLVVPVVKGVEAKGIEALSRELGAISEKARAGKLSPAEMQGGTFSISSLGGIGGTNFTPIVNAPEVAILGVVRTKTAPVWDGAEFRPRQMLPLCLSYDHRVIDGASAARFLRFLAQMVEDPRRMLV
ncbi:MAG: dihydrolipoyllysine-residue acetyltransferase [Hyphomicrobiales bacterium]|nr:dihydrolipoyllysine-residue acetyltransferase [Hyphomicrobiales bacterium]